MNSRPFSGSNRFTDLETTAVYDDYWRFAARRQEIYLRRASGQGAPWTKDPILLEHKFTNVYRASDRTSQYLIKDVLYSESFSKEFEEVVFRTILFKLFNRIDTWKLLTQELGDVSWATFDERAYDRVMTAAMERGDRLYSAAYIVPPVKGGYEYKHRGHLYLIKKMMSEKVPNKVKNSNSLSEIFWLLKSYPSLGDFIAFQISIDLNYSEGVNFSENDFVVAGPGARDGISKCFVNSEQFAPEDLIELMVDMQEREFSRLGLIFAGLWGRPLQLIDAQNVFCEISKYARVAHPAVEGISGRTRIKQKFRPKADFPQPWYPPKWGINHLIMPAATDLLEAPQRELLL